jgi:hypothetical protein
MVEVVEQRDDAFRVLQDRGGIFRNRHGPACTLKWGKAELLLPRLDSQRDGGLADAEARRRGPEAAEASDPEKRP